MSSYNFIQYNDILFTKILKKFFSNEFIIVSLWLEIKKGK